MKSNNICTAPKLLTLLLFSSCILTCCSGCGQTQPLSKTGFYFDTVISVSLYDSADQTILDGCFSLAEDYENMLSKTREGSDIWKINHSGGSPVTVTRDTALLLSDAIRYARLTDGRSDPTIGAVSKLWNFSDASKKELPNDTALADALSHVDFRLLELDNTTVTLHDPLAEIDLGFIAKGYIADRIKDYLLSQGIQSAIINLGGNVLTIGTKPDGTPFLVGVQKPFSDSGTTAMTLSVTDKSVVTSGIYERCFEKDGILYHHILDTKTGYPVRNNLLEVTILSESSVDGDALSTACFTLGLEEGMALIESLENTEAVFMTDDGVLHTTTGINAAQ